MEKCHVIEFKLKVLKSSDVWTSLLVILKDHRMLSHISSLPLLRVQFELKFTYLMVTECCKYETIKYNIPQTVTCKVIKLQIVVMSTSI